MSFLSSSRFAPDLQPARVRIAAPAHLARSTATGLHVELLDPASASDHRDAWLDLQTRCLEPNVFLDADFALTATQHLALASRPKLLFVWERGPGIGKLLAVCAVTRPSGWLRSLVRSWDHNLSALGTPLLDAKRGEDALLSMLDWGGRSAYGHAGLLFTAVAAGGPVATLIGVVARRTGRSAVTVAAWERAVLRRDPVAGRAASAAQSTKGAKEARRQRRRLADLGTVGFASARSDEDVRDAVERFLALEARGWKGASGTALLMQPSQTAFVRAMTRLLVRRGRCRVDSLTLDGAPIAMGIVLSHGDTEFLWKIAYDECFARHSPGVQFVLELTERQVREGQAAVTDSCAIPRHPMIDRLWRDRLALADIAVGTGAEFAWAVGRQRGYDHLRNLAKRARAAWKSRKARNVG